MPHIIRFLLEVPQSDVVMFDVGCLLIVIVHDEYGLIAFGYS